MDTEMPRPRAPSEALEPLMTVCAERCLDALVVTVRGEIDIVTAPVLQEKLLGLVRHDCPYLIVDLTRLDFIGARGLTALLATRTEVMISGGAGIAVVAGHHAVLAPVILTGLDGVLNLQPDLVAAHVAAITADPRAPRPDAAPR